MKVGLIAGLAAVLMSSACTRDGNQLTEPADTTGRAIASSSLAPVAATATSDQPPATPGRSAGDTATTAAPQVEVPEIGIPGLDSDDRFCAAWSRFGGSWQVLSVGSSFLGDPDRIASWEVASSAVVAQAYSDLIDAFPPQLASEADTVAEGYFGVLYRRSLDAGAALLAAGADADTIARLSDAWLAALAVRDPADPDLRFEVPADLQALVADAARSLRSQRVDFHRDPSMVVSVPTPLTDVYLETACPDQGTLTGQEIDGT